MKRISCILILTLALCMLAGCAASEDSFTYNEAGLMDLKFNIEKSWEYSETRSGSNSLAFVKGNAILGVTCAGSEATFQNGKDMIKQLKGIYAGFYDYKVIQDATRIEVNGLEWYEAVISYKEDEEDEEAVILYERCFGQDYAAYTISLVASASDYEDLIEEAKMAMDTATVDAKRHDQSTAKEFLAGEWEFSTGELLVVNEDGTYQWYMDGETRSKENMHEGNYGCDDEVKNLSTGKGRGYYYLCLMPERLYVKGEELETSSAIYHFALSQSTSGAENEYEMVNLTSMDVYSLVRLDNTKGVQE